LRDLLVEQLAGASDEGPALEILVFAGAFADEDDRGIGVAFAKYRVGAGLTQPAAGAAADLIVVMRVRRWVFRRQRGSER
jgi:hypothetical protein